MKLLDLNIAFDRCWICSAPLGGEHKVTCSDDCHEALILKFELTFGAYKRVTDLETMNIHKVPLRDIIEKGLKQEDLKNYPAYIQEKS